MEKGWGCPFCTAVQPSWAQHRQGAQVVALAQVVQKGPQHTKLRILHVLKGAFAPGAECQVPSPRVPQGVGKLALVFHWTDPPRWLVFPADELSYAYLAQAPDPRIPWPKRLEYFARFLEHPNPSVAEDAYREFALAPYEAVAQVAPKVPEDQLRQWILDPAVPQHRKGLYGLLLALGAGGEKERLARAKFLQRLLQRLPDGFRSGLDGWIGAYVLAAGTPGVRWLRQHWMAQADSGMLRHLLRALEVVHQYGPKELRPQLRQVARELLWRESVSAEAVRTLARWEDWAAVEEVVRLWHAPWPKKRLRRWILAYLILCPRAEAQHALKQIQKRHPQLVQQVRRTLPLLPLER